MLVSTEATMPDYRILKASDKVSEHRSIIETFQASADKLGRINNPSQNNRGGALVHNNDIDFWQAAYRFGCDLYQKYLTGNLRDVMCVLLNYGERASLRLLIDEAVEGLPWEAMHDGQEFVAMRVRFVRSCGLAGQSIDPAVMPGSNFGILLVGADARDDLPGTTREVDAITKFLSNLGIVKIEVLTGSNANRQRVLEMVQTGGFNVLHYSGHSVFDAAHPYES
jgi:hypothetical protein